MMKVNVSSTKLKGSVLYTVVSVLMVLIVFLMGTLALAATASNRAYSNYQKEQTEYTARALLDSVVTAINADNSSDGIKAAVQALTGEGSSVEIMVERSDNPRLDADGNVIPEIVTATKLKSQFYYVEKINPETSEPYGWQECNVYELSATVSKTMAGTTYSVIMTDMPIDVPGVADGGGAFVSMGNAAVPTQGIVTGGTAVGIKSNTIDDLEFPASSSLIIETNSFFKNNLTIGPTGTVMRFADMGSHVVVMGDLTFQNDMEWEFSPNFEENWPGDEAVSYQEIPCVFVGGKFYSNSTTQWVIDNENGKGQPINLYCGYLEINPSKESFQMTGDIYAFDEDQTSYIKTQGQTNLYKWVSKHIGLPGNKADENYSFGNFYSAGSVKLEVERGGNTADIKGDLRVAKNFDCVKNVNVGNDLVVGETLTVASGGKLTVNGDLYASNLANYGEIECTGDIHVFNVLSAGKCNKEIKPTDTTGLTAKVETKWYENVELTNISAEKPYSYSYSYTEFTRVGLEESSRVVSDTLAPSSDKCGEHWFSDEYASIQECVEATDENYQRLMNMRDNQGRVNAIQVATFDISVLYKQPVYPEGFTKREILNEIIKEPELYTSAKYDGYPQSRDLFVATYGEPQGTCTAPGVIQVSSVIKPGGYNDNIYIDANGKKLAIIIEGEVSMDNGAQIIINESNGGEVNFFLDDNAKLNFNASGGQIVTTEILRQYGYTGSDYTNKTAIQPFTLHNMSKEWDIHKVNDPLFPDVYFYAGENTEMNFASGANVTGNIRAPLMKFTEASSGEGKTTGSAINYTDEMGPRQFESGSYICMVGQLIAGEIHVLNQFGLLHVTRTDNNNNNNNNNGNNRSGDISTRYYSYY